LALPDPIPGLVICYSYLWREEDKRGQEEGLKDRPCAIVLARQVAEDIEVVTVAPITHTAPGSDTQAIELPATLKTHLGLDDEPSWVVLSEVNEFVWPGPDLRPVAGTNPPRFSYGVIPPGFFCKIRDGILQALMERKLSRVTRSQ